MRKIILIVLVLCCFGFVEAADLSVSARLDTVRDEASKIMPDNQLDVSLSTDKEYDYKIIENRRDTYVCIGRNCKNLQKSIK